MQFNKLHRWKHTLWGCSFFILGIVSVKVLEHNTKYFEDSLLQKFLLSTQHLSAWLWDRISFSVGDLIYLILTGFLFWGLRKFVRQREKRFELISQSIFWTGLIFLIFQLRWGINYYRPATFPIQKEYQKYNEEVLLSTLDILIEQTHKLHLELSKDSTSIPEIPFLKEEIRTKIEKAPYFSDADRSVKLKHSMWSLGLTYMGYSGYLNPWTLEAHINRKIPKMSYVITAAHELQHQLGIAPENEANFGAFLATSTHPDPWIRLAGYSFGLRYTLSALWKNNPEVASIYQKKIHSGIIEGYKRQAAFWKSYDNPLEKYFKFGYDRFLKSQGQALGIQSYGTVVQLLIQHFENRPTEENNSK